MKHSRFQLLPIMMVVLFFLSVNSAAAETAQQCFSRCASICCRYWDNCLNHPPCGYGRNEIFCVCSSIEDGRTMSPSACADHVKKMQVTCDGAPSYYKGGIGGGLPVGNGSGGSTGSVRTRNSTGNSDHDALYVNLPNVSRGSMISNMILHNTCSKSITVNVVPKNGPKVSRTIPPGEKHVFFDDNGNPGYYWIVKWDQYFSSVDSFASKTIIGYRYRYSPNRYTLYTVPGQHRFICIGDYITLK